MNSYNCRNGSVQKSNSLLVYFNTIHNQPLKLYCHWIFFYVCVCVCVWIKKNILCMQSCIFLLWIFIYYILEIQYIFFYLYYMMRCNKLLKQNIICIILYIQIENSLLSLAYNFIQVLNLGESSPYLLWCLCS